MQNTGNQFVVWMIHSDLRSLLSVSPEYRELVIYTMELQQRQSTNLKTNLGRKGPSCLFSDPFILQLDTSPSSYV